MSDTEQRRKFFKQAAAAAAGVVVGPSLLREAKAAGQTVAINPGAKAVMPSGQQLDRKAILSQLGLNPNTPPDAWLAVIGCGSNASALKPGSREELMRRGALRPEVMSPQTMPQH